MNVNKSVRQLIAWIVCFTILLAALAPSISHALMRDAKFSWMEICSATGTKFVKVSDNQGRVKSSAPVEKAMHTKHCAFCCTSADSLGLAQVAVLLMPAAGAAPIFPSLFYQSPSPLFVWTAAQSRAPPVAF